MYIYIYIIYREISLITFQTIARTLIIILTMFSNITMGEMAVKRMYD